MMLADQPGPKRRREPTIALINIVFLMLVFFMVAGTLSRPMDKDMTLVRTDQLEGRAPPDTLVIYADGRLSFQGDSISSAQAFLSGLPPEKRETIRVVPDRNLPAHLLVSLTGELRRAGVGRVMIVTERGLQ